jgi:hypothetical protein
MTGVTRGSKGASAGKTRKLALKKETVKDLSASKAEAAKVKGGKQATSLIYESMVGWCACCSTN